MSAEDGTPGSASDEDGRRRPHVDFSDEEVHHGDAIPGGGGWMGGEPVPGPHGGVEPNPVGGGDLEEPAEEGDLDEGGRREGERHHRDDA